MSYSEFRTTLENNVCNVKFTKVNGDFRDMDCTLKRELMPEPAFYATTQDSVEKKEHISVWDINREAWRAFRIANVQHFTIKG